jgi:hypothetical protein
MQQSSHKPTTELRLSPRADTMQNSQKSSQTSDGNIIEILSALKEQVQEKDMEDVEELNFEYIAVDNISPVFKQELGTGGSCEYLFP